MDERNLLEAALEIADPTARLQNLDEMCAERAKTPLQSADSQTIVDATGDTATSMLQAPAREPYEPEDAASQGEIDETPLAAGMLFGRYRIQRVLGTGGMGIVYLAQDTRLGRQVALKIPRFDLDGKLHLIERFRREARVMGLVQHRNLCPIIDVDEHDGRHYLTMAYIDGVPLSQVLSSRSPEVSDAIPASAAASSFTASQIAEWIRKLALALDVAHRAGVVHRDLKPANVIIDQSGEPILMDFGLAWMAHETDSRVTLAGAIIGTPAYMSPEQAACEPDRVGASSDIYSLGVIMYELLAGCPIRTGSVTRVLYKLMNETPLRPSEIRGGVDLKLEEICWKAIARRPEDRFATAAEFAEALRKTHVSSLDTAVVLPSAVGLITVDDSKPQWTQRNRMQIVLACVLLFGILAVWAATVIQHSLPSPLTGSGNHLPLAPIGKVLAAVNYKYVENKTGFTGTWSANAVPAWQGTFTATGLRPAGFYYTTEVCSHDFSGIASGVLPAGTYFTIYHLNQNDHLTLTAYDSAHTVISSPWLNHNPVWDGSRGR